LHCLFREGGVYWRHDIPLSYGKPGCRLDVAFAIAYVYFHDTSATRNMSIVDAMLYY